MSRKTKKGDQVGFDARGLPVWGKQTGQGEFKPRVQDSREMRVLKADQLSLAETEHYGATQSPLERSGRSTKSVKSRNGLDYLRALSEAIKTQRKVKDRKDD
jgi:hypothetical protein